MAKKKDKQVEDALDAWANSRIMAFFQVSTYTVVTMAIFAGGGYLIDKWLGIYPALFITGIVVSFPVVQVVIYRKFKDYAKNTLNTKK